MCGLSIRECHTVNSVLRRRSTLQGKHYHLLHTRYRAYTPSPPASTAVHAKTHFWQASPSSHRHKWGWLLTVRLREAQKAKCLVLQSPHAASKRWTFGCVWKQRPPMKTTVSFLSLSHIPPVCVGNRPMQSSLCFTSKRLSVEHQVIWGKKNSLFQTIVFTRGWFLDQESGDIFGVWIGFVFGVCRHRFEVPKSPVGTVGVEELSKLRSVSNE